MNTSPEQGSGLEIRSFSEEENVVVPDVIVPGLTTCKSSACTSTCTPSIEVAAE